MNKGGTNTDWGTTNEEASSGTYSLTDSPGANYLNDNNSWAYSPPINLSNHTAAKLEFKIYGNAEAIYDGMWVEASSNASIWSPVNLQLPGNPNLGTGVTGEFASWTTVVADLEAFDAEDGDPGDTTDEDDAIDALEDELAAGVVEDLTGNGVEVEASLEAAHRAQVEGQEVEEQRPVGLGGEGEMAVGDADAQVAANYNVERAPGLVIAAEGEDGPIDYGIRYAGIPSGHEFSSLIQDLILVSARDSGLNEQTRTFLAELKEPVHLQVFVTPT